MVAEALFSTLAFLASTASTWLLFFGVFFIDVVGLIAGVVDSFLAVGGVAFLEGDKSDEKNVGETGPELFRSFAFSDLLIGVRGGFVFAPRIPGRAPWW